jgi:hypothetical protein
LNLKAGYLLINEMRVQIDGTTRVMDQKGAPIDPAELRSKRWVYFEMEEGRAKKIYLLPHYINARERQNFRFIK